MDYDDSEFQNHSFQLVGEESNKCPSSLQSFALHDIDEHLQVHLRFDSLVDTDVLLGIQGQDNNWIEDFSSGTTAIVFSSTAAESCSISRHNNVWSEATSSESVEMLLKSVAEDEMTDRNMEAVAHDGLTGEKEERDSTLKQDNDHNLKMEDTRQNDPSLPPDKCKVERDSTLKQDDDHNSKMGGNRQNGPSLPPGKCMSNLTMVDEDTIVVQTLVEGSAVQESSHCITCTSVQDDPSSSFGNLSVGSGEIHIPVLSDQIVEEDIQIIMTERSDFLSGDGRKETSHIMGRDEVNEQYLRGQEAMSHLSSGKDSSFLDPIMDSLVPMDQECKKSGYCENPDGLLEAITYPVKALNKDTEASESSTPARDMCSPMKEGDASIGPQSLKVGNEHVPVLSHLGENSEDVCYKQSDSGSKVEYLHAELPTRTAKNRGEEQLDSFLEVTGGEESPECHLIENSNVGDTPEMTLEVHVAAPVDFETQINEVKDVNGLESFKSQNPEPAVVEKHFEDEVTKKVEAEVYVSDAKPNDAHMRAALSDVDVKITYPVADDLGGKDELVPSIRPDVTSENNDDGVSTEKAEDTSSSGKNAGTTSVSTDTVAKMTKDESVIVHALVDVEMVSLEKDTNIQQSHPDVSNLVDGAVEQKEKSIDAHLPNELVAIIDPVVTSSSHPKGELHNESGTEVASLDRQDISAVEQNDETNSSPLASELVQPHKKEIIFSTSAYLSHPEGNLLTQLSSRPVTKPTIDDHSPLDSTTESQTIIDGQFSSYVDNVDPLCHNEPQSLTNKPISQESTVGIEGVLVNDSASNVKDGSVSPAVSTSVDKEIVVNVTVGLASNDEGQTLLETPSSEKNSSGGAQNSFTNVSAFPSSRSDSEDHLVEANNGKPSSLEPNCGSPTVISCSGHVQDQDGSMVLSDRTCIASNRAPQISSETGGSRDKVQLKAEDDRSFTFEVGSLADHSKKHSGSERKPFPIMQTSEPPKISKEKSHGSHKESKEGKQHGVRRNSPNADKTTGANESLSTPKGKKSVKGTPIVKKHVDKDARSFSVTSSTSVGTVSRDTQLEESRQCESNEMKASCSPIVQTSGLPDLNSSVAVTTLFNQPFTDLQQVQLRAQIFVYGSLIQAIPPDEACMVSAFGGTDRGRNSWEAAWRLSSEKYQNQKSPLVNSETKHPRSAVRVPEHVARSSSFQSKVSNTSANQSGGKVVPSALQNSTPLPSPVWSISTNDVLNPNKPRGVHLDFNQALSPLQSYYSSQTRQFANNSMPWSSQAPHNGPGGVPIQGSTLNAVTQYSTVPFVETVQVTPVRDSSMPRAPHIQLVAPSALLPTSSPSSVTAVTVTKNETQRKTASAGTNKNVSNSQKPRKRKKVAGSEDVCSTIPVSQSTTEPGSTAIAKTVPLASADLVSSSSMPTKVASGNLITTTPNIFPAPYQIVSNNSTEQRAIFSEETNSRIEQAKLQAEDAASLAAASVRHSQDIWSQLAAQRDTGLASEVEVKLASVAVAAAAAASVAKAAAAAAKVALDAALQAKMMADETLGLATKGTLTQIPESGSATGKNLGRLTPDSVLKGKDKINGSSSVISTACEAAGGRVEAASAATKRAENIDAIVKAAELAAEAVSQAGAIIAMGDPLPFRLSDLVDAGLEAFWKVPQTGTENLNTNNLFGAGDVGLNHSDHHDRVIEQSNEEPLSNKGIQKTGTEYRVSNSGTLAGNYQDELVNSVTARNDRHQRDQLSTNLMESDIKSGSLVEVVSDADGLRGAWFSARVLDLKDNKAYVCYDNLLTDKGSGQLKEWLSLEGEGNTAPRIRMAHPMTTSKHEGTRKRRREAIGNYVWAVGDHVDVWLLDRWREGIVTEKIQGDETKLTVRFPAGDDSSVVRAWNLRPSLVWKDGQWTEWLRARENTLCPSEGDTPKEKRPKLGRSEANFDGDLEGRVGKLWEKIPLEDPGHNEESMPLNLSAKDRVFSVGRNAREESISDALKVKRTGFQKERSRVVFGVPKPGKKRKFMEVSKHYVTDNKTDKTEGNDSLKFAKYLMPQQSRPWKNTSKVEPKGKQAGEFNKTRGIKSVKSQTIQTRSTSEKDISSLSTTSVSNRGGSSRGALHNFRAGINEKSTLEKNPVEVISFPSTLGTSASLSLDSCVQALPRVLAAKKSTSAAEGDSGAKGRSTSSVDKQHKPTRSEDKRENSVKEIPDSVEPRRSNRKIQPTSRLLEGLQSSLIISKIPSFSHDRGARPKHRGSSSSRGSSRG